MSKNNLLKPVLTIIFVLIIVGGFVFLINSKAKVENNLPLDQNEETPNIPIKISDDKKPSVNITAGLKKAFSMWENGEISECTFEGKTYYSGGENAYDGGGATLDTEGNIVGGCQGFSGKCEGIIPQTCERIYAVYPNIWGYPAVNKYNLK